MIRRVRAELLRLGFGGLGLGLGGRRGVRGLLPERGEEVAVAGDAGQHLLGVEAEQARVAGAGAAPDLLQGDRGRDRRPGGGPHRVDGDGRLGRVVLAPVDQDPAPAQLLAHDRDDQVTVLGFELPGQVVRLVADRVPAGAGGHGAVELEPLLPAGLGQDDRVGLGQGLHDELGHGAALDDGGSFSGIEVEDHLVGVGRELAAPGRTPQRHVELDGAQVGRPDQRRQVRHGGVGDFALAIGGDGQRLDPAGAVRGHVLLEEELALDAVGEALHGEGATRQVRQHRLGDAGVVVDELPLGEAGLGKEDLVQVGDRQLAVADAHSLRAALRRGAGRAGHERGADRRRPVRPPRSPTRG